MTTPLRCAGCAARPLAFCSTLPDEDLEALDRLAVRRTLHDGARLSEVGDANDYCAHVLRGLLKLQVLSADGRVQTVAILNSGDFFGQLFNDRSRLTSVAAGEVDLCVYSRVALEQLASRRPAIMRALLTSMSNSLEAARHRQISFAQKPAIARLAEFLAEQTKRGSEVLLPLNRTDLANYLGMPIETLSRQLSKLKSDDVISVQPGSKTIAILDEARLTEIASI